jgi:SagB-type dehydrogenase family enzyme
VIRLIGQDSSEYIRLLRDDPDVLRAEAGTVDSWRAPRPLKRYTGGTRVSLNESLDKEVLAARQSALHRLFLFSAGYLSVHRSWAPMSSVRAVRAVASGGGLYPAELYLLTREEHAFYYDASAHELVGISSVSNHRLKIRRALGLQDHGAPFELALVITLEFGRSYFKYGDFSYLLSAADAGVMLGRVHRLARLEYGEATVSFDFNDREVNDMLGIDGHEESAYAVMLVGTANGTVPSLPGLTSDFRPSYALPIAQPVQRSVTFDALHQSVLDQGATLPAAMRSMVHDDAPGDPAQSAELCRVIRRRRSLGHRFSGQPVHLSLMSGIIKEVSASISDLRAASIDVDLPELELYVMALHINDAPSGAYRFEPSTGMFACIAEGRWGAALQGAQRSSNINVDQAAFVVHGVGKLDLSRSVRMNRSYRVQQMIAGAAMDYIMLASCSRGLAAHPVLGFRGSAIDPLYKLAGSGRGSLTQVCVGWVGSTGSIECSIVV